VEIASVVEMVETWAVAVAVVVVTATGGSDTLAQRRRQSVVHGSQSARLAERRPRRCHPDLQKHGRHSVSGTWAASRCRRHCRGLHRRRRHRVRGRTLRSLLRHPALLQQGYRAHPRRLRLPRCRRRSALDATTRPSGRRPPARTAARRLRWAVSTCPVFTCRRRLGYTQLRRCSAHHRDRECRRSSRLHSRRPSQRLG
jgi:hypothetical protein